MSPSLWRGSNYEEQSKISGRMVLGRNSTVAHSRQRYHVEILCWHHRVLSKYVGNVDNRSTSGDLG